MLLEFDADQRSGRKRCVMPSASSARRRWSEASPRTASIPTPVWKAYVEHGWTEMNDPETAVELAIVLEELGRATDPTPFLATMTQFAPLAADRFDPRASGTAVYGGVTAHRDGERGCSTAPPATCWTATAPTGWRS